MRETAQYKRKAMFEKLEKICKKNSKMYNNKIKILEKSFKTIGTKETILIGCNSLSQQHIRNQTSHKHNKQQVRTSFSLSVVF